MLPKPRNGGRMATGFSRRSGGKIVRTGLLPMMRCLGFALVALLPCMVHSAPIKVTFINPGRSDETFWVMVSDAMRAAASDLDVELTVHYAERNRVRMRELGLAAAGRPEETDYLIVVNEEQYGTEIVEAADAHGLKTIMLLNDLTEEQKRVFGHARSDHPHWIGSITPDNRTAGWEMAIAITHAAVERYGRQRPVRVFALAGDRTTPASIERTGGLLDAVGSEQFDAPFLDRIVYANWRADEAYRLTSRYLEWSEPRGQTAPAIWAANDPIAFGAMRALREHGLRPGMDVFVAGLNWSSGAVALVDSDEMVLTHGGHFLGGAWVIVLLRDYHEGYDFAVDGDPNVRFPMMAIERSNVERFAAVLGDEDWDKIDFAAFSRSRGEAEPGYRFTLAQILKQFD